MLVALRGRLSQPASCNGAAQFRTRYRPRSRQLGRFSRISVGLETGPAQRQGWQIVQSHLNLDDSLP